MTGTNDQDFEREDGNYTNDDERLKALIESGEIPEDVHDIEAALSFDSNDKGKTDADEAPKPGADTPAGTDTKQDDTTGADATGGEPKGEQPAATPPADTVAKPAEGDTSGPAEKPAGEGADADVKPEGVLSRNGKHVIPYDVLRSERDRARTLADRNKALEEELEQLRTRQAGATDRHTAAEEDLAAAEQNQQTLLERFGVDTAAKDLFNADGTLNVDKLKDEFDPAVVNILAATNKIVVGLSKTVDDQHRQLQDFAQRESELVQDSVQDAIDATPGLAAIQAAGGHRWTLARSYDRQLREDPDWARVPLRVRFSEVDHVVRGGDPRTPAEAEAALYAAAPPTPTPEKKSDSDSQPGNPQERAAQLLRENAGAGTVPSTHSDLPAGERPVQDGPDRLEQMSVIDLEEAFENASDPDALIAKYL